jgi:hypothetical protein
MEIEERMSANLLAAVKLCANFLVWAASAEAKFLKGKVLWSNWDVDELKARRAELEGAPKYTVGLLGYI